MFGAIYVGLSGLQAYSEGLQKFSNNVANLNSTGFKSSEVSFTNLQASRDSAGLSLQQGSGGSGGGVGLAQTAIDFSAGELRQTERDLDLAIDGGMLEPGVRELAEEAHRLNETARIYCNLMAANVRRRLQSLAGDAAGGYRANGHLAAYA